MKTQIKIGKEDVRKEMQSILNQARIALKFPWNIVFFPYHLFITAALIIVKITGTLSIPWHLALAPTIISLIVIFYMITTAASAIIVYNKKD